MRKRELNVSEDWPINTQSTNVNNHNECTFRVHSTPRGTKTYIYYFIQSSHEVTYVHIIVHNNILQMNFCSCQGVN